MINNSTNVVMSIAIRNSIIYSFLFKQLIIFYILKNKPLHTIFFPNNNMWILSEQTQITIKIII